MEENIDLLQDAPQPETQVETPEETVPPPTTETPRRKSSVLTIIISVLFLLILGVAGYFGYENYVLKNQVVVPPRPKPTVKPPVVYDPTADWEIFESTVYKYTIQHPLDWTVGAPHNMDPTEFREPVFDSKCDHDAGELCQQFFIEAIETNTATDLEPNIIIKEDDIVIKEQDLIIDGQNAVGFEVYQTNYNNVPGKLLYIVVTNNNGFKYTIFYQEYKKDKEFKTESDWENKDLFDQILSTFEFVGKCSADDECSLNICDCKADLKVNIEPEDTICTRHCPGVVKCISGQCQLSE